MFKSYKNQFLTVITAFFLILFQGPVATAPLFGGNDENVIWQSGPNRYFKYFPQDNDKYGRNDHPVELDQQDISTAVEALRIKKSGILADDDETEPVFSLAQAKQLGEYLSVGLKNARPDQDIIFSLERTISQLIFLKDNVFVVGRAFYKNGKLNIIIGEYNFFRNKEFERVYDSSGQIGVTYPFNYGSRSQNSGKLSRNLITSAGIANKRVDNEIRQDWFEIDVAVAAKAYLAKKNESAPGEGVVDDRAIRLEAARLAKERRELRVEMARMRKEIQEGNNNKEQLSIEERLARLDELRQKELITADEYAQKRDEILNDI